MSYKIFFHPQAVQELHRLEGSVKRLVLKQIAKLSRSPLLGEELGNRNGFNLTGYRKMYVDKKRVRIVYRVRHETVEVFIIAIGKRGDMEVYGDAARRV
ncbi:MAG: type II toxin-antitoxin system RelE/ParE family toxin [Treponemataceae bacterium]|nr:type II toxin-antitoxin system RelE/ParE family toxin [Treponemataceae bacterium]